ncbi:hypothetical protein JQ604_24200 [Bradyrhizobium jicamae]|uniref:hypothetical protein n=1 Tax=Bradyrhizobium jicamae TaxID=280332 RepID=UPI001BABA7EB|nr:hypothetical protein [Bradyrhizobium jicamae]MBR0755298.1 hypothetical protein [Bradyrhizobium jicamae]
MPNYFEGQDIRSDVVSDFLLLAPDDWHDANASGVHDKFFGNPRQRLRFGVALLEAAPYLPLAARQPLLKRATSLDPFLVTSHWDSASGDSVIGTLLDQGDWPERTSLTHCNHMSDELGTLARAGIGICITPDIECGMGTGPLVARRFVDQGGAASLGTDLSSYLRADILQQARILLQVERKSLAETAGKLPTKIGWHARPSRPSIGEASTWDFCRTSQFAP